MAGERIGISGRPQFLLFERPFSDWGEFDSHKKTPNYPMQNVIEDFMYFASSYSAEWEKQRRLDRKLDTSQSVGIVFDALNPSNSIHLRVVEGRFVDTERKLFYVALPHFRQVMVFDTKNGPQMRFRRAELVTEWISVGGIQASGALDYPAGPAQIEQYSDILSYARRSIEQGNAHISSRITGRI